MSVKRPLAQPMAQAIFAPMSEQPPSKGSDPAPESPPENPTHFGYREVEAAEKGSLVRGVFESVAGKYDLMNDLMSGGIHRLWKGAMIDLLGPKPGTTLLDVAGGTGDIALRALDRMATAQDDGENGAGQVIVCDLTADMLQVGRDRAIDRGYLKGLGWVCGDAQRLPLSARAVDAYTIAFGLRNVTDIDLALREAQRVLRPGGRFVCLEFSHVVLPVLKELYDLYSFQALPALGAAVTGDRAAYQYLVESIRRFPPQEELAAKLKATGFAGVRVKNLTGGIAALHSGWRV